MSTHQNESESNAVILTRTVERVFRKLIRFLVGKISLVKLQEIIRNIYVEESERKLRLEKPGRDVPLTRLALVTGLDTRTLAKIRNDELYRRPLHEQERFIKTMTPESCVVDFWRSNSKYYDLESQKPKKLKVWGNGLSFEQLVKDAVTSRGITSQSILTSLVQNKTIKFDEEQQTIELLEKIIAPFKAGNQWGALELGLLHACSLIETVFHNFAAVRDKKAVVFPEGLLDTSSQYQGPCLV